MNIDDFLIEIFKNNPGRIFDFFYEGQSGLNPVDINKEDIINNELINLHYTTRYIENISKVVYSNINFVNNKIHVSKYLPNVRFHYFNFRSTIKNFDKLSQGFIYNTFDYNSMKINLEKIKELVLETISDIQTDTNEYINKLKYKYHNIIIKNKIIELYQKYVIQFANNISDIIDQTIKYINETPKLFDKYINIIEKYEIEKLIICNLTILNDSILFFSCNLIDLFLLRRLLDKQYINNCIIYCGTYHMDFITYLLVKYFNFKISHCAHVDNIKINNSIDTLHEIIIKKTMDNYNNRLYIQTLFDNKLQCSNLFNFPKDLL